MPWIEKYLAEVRPKLVSGRDDGALFLSRVGTRVRPNKLSDIVRRYVGASGIAKKGACHLFRHTMATLMLENGADIRFIQQMLGHAEISTTQIYTQVSVKKLKEVHALTHPARLERPAKRGAGQRSRRPTTCSRPSRSRSSKKTMRTTTDFYGISVSSQNVHPKAKMYISSVEEFDRGRLGRRSTPRLRVSSRKFLGQIPRK